MKNDEQKRAGLAQAGRRFTIRANQRIQDDESIVQSSEGHATALRVPFGAVSSMRDAEQSDSLHGTSYVKYKHGYAPVEAAALVVAV